MPAATDAVFIDVLPSMKGFGPAMAKGAKTQGAAAGTVAGVSFGKAALAATAAIAGGAVLATKALYNIGKTFQGVEKTIIVGTGASGKALDDLMASAKRVGQTTPASFEDIGVAVADLNTRLGLTGKPLEDLSAKFLNMSRITDTDLSTNIANVTRVFGDWGVETKDQSKALDTIFEATKRTGIGLDTLTTNVVQFGAPLRQMGFGFEESLALFGKWEKEGVNTQVVLSGMKQALGRFSDAGKAPAEEFRRVQQAIKDAGSAGEANSIAIEAFGMRAGPDMAAAIREGRFEIDELVEGLKDSEGSIDDADKRTRTFSESWQIFKNKAMVGLAPLATKVFDAIERGMTWFIDKGIPALATLKPIFDEVKGAIAAFGAAWAYNDGEVTSSGLPGFMERLGYWARQTFGFVKDTVIPNLRSLVRVVVDNKEAIVPLVAGFVAFKAIMAGMAIMTAVSRFMQLSKAVGIARAIQLQFNLALVANPIGLVVAALAVLVAAVVVAYKNSETFRDVVDRAWAGVKNAVQSVVGWFTGTAWPTIKKVWDNIAAGAMWLWNSVLKPAWEGIRLAVQVAVELIRLYWNNILKPVFTAYADVLQWLWRTVVKPVFERITAAWRAVVDSVRHLWNTVLKPAWDAVAKGATWLWERALRPVFGWIGDRWDDVLRGMKVIYDTVLKPMFDAFDKAGDKLRDGIKSAVDGIGRAWDGLKRAFASPVNWVIDNVINKFLGWVNRIADDMGLSIRLKLVPNVSWGKTAPGGAGGGGLLARNRGGLIPGGGPDRDSVLTHLTPGEYVMSRSAVNRIGLDNLEALNRAGREGRGLEIGGPIGWLRDAATAALNKARKFIVDLARPGFDRVMDLMDGTVGQWGIPGRFAAGTSRKVGNSMLDWMGGIEKEADSRTPELGPGIGWKAMWAAVQKAFPWAQLHSGYRPGAITATGNPSYHGMGRAVDLTPSMDIFNWIKQNYGDSREVIFSPANGRQIWNGQPHMYGGVTRANHWDHVHWAYDQGGMLPPGVSQVANWTGKPEAVLTDGQWRTMQAAAAGHDGPVTLSDESIADLTNALLAGAGKVVTATGAKATLFGRQGVTR